MKKLVLTLLTVICAVSAWAVDVTFTFKTDNDITYTNSGTSGGGSSMEISKGGVTITSTNGYTASGKSLSVYAGATMTVSVSGTITKIVASYASGCRPFKEAMPEGVTSTTNKLSSACDGTWSGSASSVTLTNEASGKTELTKLVVTYTSNGGTTTLTVPSNLSASSITKTSATLTWDAVSNASSYTVKIGETEYTGVNTNSYSATGLTAGTQYTWTVKAVGDGANYSDSQYAASTNFTTEEDGTDPEPEPTPTDGITYTLGSFSNIGDYHDVILVWTNSTASYGITNGNGTTNPPTAKAVTITDNKISYSENDIVWTIKNYDAEKGTFEIWSKADATKYLYATNTNNGVRVGGGAANTFQIKDNYLYEDGTTDARYLGIYNNADIRCYTSINSNISGQTIAVYYRELKSFDLIISANGWASMSVDFNAEVPEDASAYYASAKDINDESGTITLDRIKAGEVIPAGEGVVVKGTGTVTFKESTETPVVITNLFTGTATGAATVAASSAWVLNGAHSAPDAPYFSVFTGTEIPANKAYLAAAAVGGAKTLVFSVDDNVTTSINTIESTKNTGVAYNLVGQRVAANAKGIVIINGKKYIVK